MRVVAFDIAMLVWIVLLRKTLPADGEEPRGFLKQSSSEPPHGASIVHEFRSRYYILCAFLTLEKMRFKFIAQWRRKFA